MGTKEKKKGGGEGDAISLGGQSEDIHNLLYK